MAEYVYKSLRTDNKHKNQIRELSDYKSILFEIDALIEYCDIYKETVDLFFSDDFTLRVSDRQSSLAEKSLRPIAEAALVKYVRIMKGGVRRKFPLSTSTLSPENEGLHLALVQLRDKHIAHSVSPIENYNLRIYYDRLAPENKDRWSLGFCGSEVCWWSSIIIIESLRTLGVALKEVICREITEKSDILIAAIKHYEINDVAVEENLNSPLESVMDLAQGRRRP